MSRLFWLLTLSLCGTSCQPDSPVEEEPSAIFDVEVLGQWQIPSLTSDVHVLRTEGSIPHIYSTNREDLARVQGFVLGQDRFFSMDLARRLSLGTLSELLGESALPTDQESRGIAMAYVAKNILTSIENDDTIGPICAAYVEGINAYIEAVIREDLPAPTEYTLLQTLVNADKASVLMVPFTLEGIAGIAATITYNLGFETTDMGRAAAYQSLDGLFDKAPFSELRESGAFEDILGRTEPVFNTTSSDGWGLWGTENTTQNHPVISRHMTHLPHALLERASAKLRAIETRMGHDYESGWGSNVWAVSGSTSTDGYALLAGDGHLPLTVPGLFYQIGLNTQELGGEAMHHVGLVFPGLPQLAVGTNGHIAWSQTQLFGDITDWYQERISLDADGLPTASLFQGEWYDLERTDEIYEIREAPLLGTKEDTQSWPHWTTFDGRWLVDIEGEVVSPDSLDGTNLSVVNMLGEYVIPGDTNSDGEITGISFDYTGLDPSNLITTVEGFGNATDVWELREATRGLVAYSQNIIAADSGGSIFYTGYQAVPCRNYLPRNPDGSWQDGANPNRLLDGSTYGGFTIPMTDGIIDEEPGLTDPSRCVVPFDVYPQSIDPDQGYLLNANNDPGGMSLDGTLENDDYYIGGPWLEGYRAHRIEELLDEATRDGWADEEGMAIIQGDHHPTLGEQMIPYLLDAIENGRSLAALNTVPEDPAEARIAALYDDWSSEIDEVEERLTAWVEAGLPARSGVATFYSTPEAGDDLHSVATSVFHTWIGRYISMIFNDEGLPSVWYPTGDTGRTRTLARMLLGRGADNPGSMASWNEETGESIFFDRLQTSEVETSVEIALLALIEGLEFLASDPIGPGHGGFGTWDMEEWIWGLRHLVQFESILTEILGNKGTFSFIISLLSITPDVLPLDNAIPSSDPRHDLPWFPRHGDHFNVDAANPGLGGTNYHYGSGPVFRMVFALKDGEVKGRNILPGGQSGNPDSPYYADQAALWLGNNSWPVHYAVEDVVANATHREVFSPALENTQTEE